MKLVLFDTETTGLLKPSSAPIAEQPYITEFAAAKVELHPDAGGEGYTILDTLTFTCKPPIPIPEEVTKITGITDADVADAPPFAAFVDQVCEFFHAERHLAAHNAAFDVTVLWFELLRLNRHLRFPWPMMHHDTVDLSRSVPGERKSRAGRFTLTELHTALTGAPPAKAHRALDDVLTLATCCVELHRRGLLAA